MIFTQVEYKVKQGMHTRFSHIMFGRLNMVTRNGIMKVYYTPGVLDNIPYEKNGKCKIIIKEQKDIDFEPVIECCEKFYASSCSFDKEFSGISGRKRHETYVKNKGLEIHNGLN